MATRTLVTRYGRDCAYDGKRRVIAARIDTPAVILNVVEVIENSVIV